MPGTSTPASEGEAPSPLLSSSASPSTSYSSCCWSTTQIAPTTGAIHPTDPGRTPPHHHHSPAPDDRLSDEIEHVLQQTESTIRGLHTSVEVRTQHNVLGNLQRHWHHRRRCTGGWTQCRRWSKRKWTAHPWSSNKPHHVIIAPVCVVCHHCGKTSWASTRHRSRTGLVDHWHPDHPPQGR